MKTIKLNSNLFPIISVAMYSTILEPYSIFYDYQINEDFENGDFDMNANEFWDKFDNSKYVEKIQDTAATYLDGKVESKEFEISINIECGEIYSPKYYNFANDEIDLTVSYDDKAILSAAKKNKEQFNQFLKENYSSYDGFLSHTANNFEEWLTDFKDDNVQSIGAVLTFLFKGEFEDMQQDFIYTCFENLHYSEFIND